jgi:hypothetical protein
MATNSSRRVVRLGAAIALVALITSACSSGAKTTTGASTAHSQTNGLETKTAVAVEQAAADALKAATSVHVTGTGTSEGKPASLDVRLQGANVAGSITLAGVTVEVIITGNDTYLKADQAAYKAFGLPLAAQQRAAGRWAKITHQQMNLEQFSIAGLAAQLTKNNSPLQPAVEQAELEGKKVVVISQQDGSKMYVSNTGPAYPLRADSTGPDAGRLDFTEYGVDFHITAPSDAIDLTTLG